MFLAGNLLTPANGLLRLDQEKFSSVMSNRKGFRAAYVVHDEKVAMLLVDPMRRTILNLLADKSYTESQLSELLGLTDASVGHHLRILLHAKLIRVEKREEENHGSCRTSIDLCLSA